MTEQIVPSKKDKRPAGTHDGFLDGDARARRSAKNARNRSRRGQATRAPGSQRRPAKTGSSKRR